jgi:murein L,D-transpeptidase YcbB/YkuD
VLRVAGALALALSIPTLGPAIQTPAIQTEETSYPMGTPAADSLPGWDLRSARDLLGVLDRAASHGLDPSSYPAESLRAAIAQGDAVAIREAAEKGFVLIAQDLANGREPTEPVARRFAGGATRLDAEGAATLMRDALSRGDVAQSLEQLAPQDTGYLALRNALGALPQSAPVEQRAALVATLERHRWMPREPQGRMLLVNIPAYRIDLVEDGNVIESHRVIVGKPSTPTPQFTAAVEAVTINPRWSVPASIVAESVGSLIRTRPATARARGYSWSRSAGGGLSVVQAPGDQNALGRLKLELPNPFNVYIHDTNARELFERPERAFSHGCIRLAEPTALAATLLADAGWDAAGIEKAIRAGKTVRAPLRRAIPVRIVYFTAEASPDGGAVHYWRDVYRLDRSLARGVVTGQAPGPALATNETECSGTVRPAG